MYAAERTHAYIHTYVHAVGGGSNRYFVLRISSVYHEILLSSTFGLQAVLFNLARTECQLHGSAAIALFLHLLTVLQDLLLPLLA